VVADQQSDQQQFGLQPAHLQISWKSDEHGKAENDAERGADGHDGEQSSFHDLEAPDAERIRCVGVINEQARQIKQTCKPGHNRDHVQRFQPEHGCSV
jgi:hypothetical protein